MDGQGADLAASSVGSASLLFADLPSRHDDERLYARPRAIARPTRRDRGRTRSARRRSPATRTIARLRCLRGIDRLSALGLCAEIGEFDRFEHPDSLSAYLRDRALGEHHRRATTSGIDHHGRLDPRPQAADRGVLLLPTTPCDRPSPRAPPTRPITRHRQHRMARPATAERPLANAQTCAQEARRLTLTDNPWRWVRRPEPPGIAHNSVPRSGYEQPPSQGRARS